MGNMVFEDGQYSWEPSMLISHWLENGTVEKVSISQTAKYHKNT